MPDEATASRTEPDSRSEKEKMLAGNLYHAAGPVLTRERQHAEALLARYNASPPGDRDGRTAILFTLLGSLGESVTVQPTFRCDYGYNISLGDGTFINYDCVFLDCNRITIGRDVQIAPCVQLYTASHPLDPAGRRSGLEFARPITLADNVWLGGGTIVCPGVTVGENTVVGAGSVVTRDLPANVVAAGNPCRILRNLPAP